MDLEYTREPLKIIGPTPGFSIYDDGGDYGIIIDAPGEKLIIAETIRLVDKGVEAPALGNACLFVNSANMYETLTHILELAMTGLPAAGMSQPEWDMHRLWKIEREARAALQHVENTVKENSENEG